MKKKPQTGSPEQLEILFPERATPAELASASHLAPVTPPSAAEPVRSAETARRGFRVIQGGGQRQQENLDSRDAVVRVLIEAGADLLLRKISAERAEHIEKRVNKILDLFDRVDAAPALMPVLQRQLDELERLMSETRAGRARRPG